MEPDERRSLVERLQSSREMFFKAVAGVSDRQAKFKPLADRWSIEDIAEHVAVAEHGMFRLITAHYEPLETPAGRDREETVFDRGRDRTRRLDTPERVGPKGRYGSLSKALQQFAENRERTIRYIGECEDDLRRRSVEHLVGKISCQECLMVLIAHPIRHAEQIHEIKQMRGYPTD
jgi:uncharacterized damage-inducible protein DinB